MDVPTALAASVKRNAAKRGLARTVMSAKAALATVAKKNKFFKNYVYQIMIYR